MATTSEHDGAGPDRRLADKIAAALPLESWDAERTEGLVAELESAIQFQRDCLPHSLDLEAEKRRRDELRKGRKSAKRRAETYEAAARAIQESTPRAVSHLLGIRGHVIDSKVHGYDRTRLNPHLLIDDLRKLARGERWIEARGTALLRGRKHSADDLLVDLVEELLLRHGVDPTAYPDPVNSMSTGTLVTVCALMRGEKPTKAGWVVKAAVRLRAQRRA